MQSWIEPKACRDLAHVAVLGWRDERDADALCARAPGAPDPVDVGLAVCGRIKVDHMRDSAHVDPAGGDIGRNERVDGSGLETSERLFTLSL